MNNLASALAVYVIGLRVHRQSSNGPSKRAWEGEEVKTSPFTPPASLANMHTRLLSTHDENVSEEVRAGRTVAYGERNR